MLQVILRSPEDNFTTTTTFRFGVVVPQAGTCLIEAPCHFSSAGVTTWLTAAPDRVWRITLQCPLVKSFSCYSSYTLHLPHDFYSLPPSLPSLGLSILSTFIITTPCCMLPACSSAFPCTLLFLCQYIYIFLYLWCVCKSLHDAVFCYSFVYNLLDFLTMHIVSI